MCFEDIPQYHTFLKIEQIAKGWSSDTKYYVEKESGEKLLLRISDIAEYDKKKSEYEVVLLLSKLCLPMSKPIDFGICNHGENVYMLLSWIDGYDLENMLSQLSSEEQYKLGFKAGQYLKKIHSIKAPLQQVEWEIRFNKKIDRNINWYKNCDIRFSGDDKMLLYIEQNRHLLKSRPQCLHHGDYHVGNMIYSPNNGLSIIDFNRFDYGDPWEEFNRIVWCADCSKYFASGRVDGYFNGEVPYEFWQLLALYICSNTLGSVYWAISFGEAEVHTMLTQANQVLDWYCNMENPIPKWYQSL
ncbi:phosphotransferase family protein [Paludicola sp. MB14-C6]|uniref:aminoglycoside phosphotransferase family protein n=1 Tax=Paludihabitans sp. MB14-C6 TaxID=3070656 RepID=UPI0027DB057E|nr:phosphotransferase family protein [Paludicola sp. MB14-C6]WMJ22371.1 phosphotransferase family protein [Paludicola sp. MB14-C6]